MFNMFCPQKQPVMFETSKKEPQKILRLRYHCLKEYDLEGDRVDTDEFIYDSDVSVEDRVQVPRLGKTWPAVLKGSVKETSSTVGRDESDGAGHAGSDLIMIWAYKLTVYWSKSSEKHRVPRQNN